MTHWSHTELEMLCIHAMNAVVALDAINSLVNDTELRAARKRILSLYFMWRDLQLEPYDNERYAGHAENT